MDLAEKALSGLKRDREGRWRWLYWLSVALFLSAVAMPYVVAWLWERDLIVRYRPWGFYNLEIYYLNLFLLSAFLLSTYKALTGRYFYLIFLILSIWFIMIGNSNYEHIIFDKEYSTIFAIRIVYISFLLSFLERFFRVKMPRKWLLYSWRAFLVLVFVFIFLFLGGYVYSPYPGWYYSPGLGYLSRYDALVKNRNSFLISKEYGIKNEKVPESFVLHNYLCNMEKIYDKLIECAKLNLSDFMEKCSEQESGIVRISIYVAREVYRPYIVIYYDGKRLYETFFYDYLPDEANWYSDDVKHVTYCRKDESENKGGVKHER